MKNKLDNEISILQKFEPIFDLKNWGVFKDSFWKIGKQTKSCKII